MSTVRIIAGRWRGRRLPVASVAGLRPTTDRVRETLFNWLQPYIDESRCLDLFAGSGALGFEALSRGAAAATLVERNARVVRQLHASADLLGADNAHIVKADAWRWAQRYSGAGFDLVFADPPYADGGLDTLLATIDATQLLCAGGLVYAEHARQAPLTLPAGWSSHRSGHAGAASFHLLARSATSD